MRALKTIFLLFFFFFKLLLLLYFISFFLFLSLSFSSVVTDGLDTRLTSCWAHDGSHEKKQQLLDADGCSVDASILANVQERSMPHSGVKLLFTKFRAFKFPGRDHLHFKCTVLVCKGKCPLVISVDIAILLIKKICLWSSWRRLSNRLLRDQF